MVMFGKGSISTSMNARIVGTGEQVLVLAHGFGTDQTLWDKIVPSLSQKHRVILFDWNFSGAATKVVHDHEFDEVKYSNFDSYADDLIHLMDEMELKSSSSCVFIGHSMSGMIGCIASVKRPQLFKKLILIGASPRYLNADDYEGGFEAKDIDQVLKAIETNFYGWAEAFAPAAAGGKDTMAAEKFKAGLTKMKPETALAIGKIIFLGDERDILEQVVTPCTIIQTKNDLVVPNSVPYYMQKKMTKGKTNINVEIIDCDGHFPMLTDPSLLVDVLDKSI